MPVVEMHQTVSAHDPDKVRCRPLHNKLRDGVGGKGVWQMAFKPGYDHPPVFD